MKTFERVREYLIQIPYINHGGCGFAAFFMHLWLKNNTNIPSEIVYGYEWDDDPALITNKGVLSGETSSQLKGCDHAFVYLVGVDKYVDSRRVINEWEYKIRLKIPPERMPESLANIGSWNSVFDRKNVLAMENDLGISLPQKEKFNYVPLF